MKKASVWADTHLTGLNISPFVDLYVLIHSDGK